MSGTSNAGTVRLSSLDEATEVSTSDLLLLLQLDTTVSPNVYRLRRAPVALLENIVAQSMTAAQFAAQWETFVAGLPTTLPNTTGVAWNNAGVVSQS
jgi:hypothetical protein